MSLRQLAAPGVSYAFISRIEAGDRRPSLKAMRVLARKLGVTPEYLETGRPIPPDAERELRVSDAELELRLGRDLEKAEQVFREESESEAETAEPGLLARVDAGMGLLAARRNETATAIRLLEAAIASEYLPPEARPDLYETLGRLYTSHGAAYEAITLFERCLEEVRKRAPEDAALRARFATYLAAAHSAMGAIDRARKALEEATEALRDVQLPQARTQVYWVMAFNEWKAGRSRTALTYMRRAIGLLESGEDTLQLARAHLVAAQMLTLDGRYPQAGKHLERAERLLALGADPSDLAVLHAERAKVLADAGRGDEALALATEAERLVGDDVLLRPVVHHGLAAAYAAKDDAEGAGRYFRAALDELAKRRQWREAARVAREWSIMLRRLDRVAEALDMMEEATVLTARHVGTLAHRRS
jgi:tetratricopeptide (TPR) repeat protein